MKIRNRTQLAGGDLRCEINTLVLYLIVFLSFFQGGFCQTVKDVYKIQVASSSSMMAVLTVQKNLRLTDSVSEHIIGGRYKYFVGNFPSFQEAQKYLVNVPVQGAYVVKIPGEAATTKVAVTPVKKDNLPVAKPNQVEKPALTTDKVLTEKVIALQIAASKDYLDPNKLKEKYKLNEEVKCIKIEGWYKYVIGSFPTESDATQRQKVLGFPAVLITYDAPISYTKTTDPKQDVAIVTRSEMKFKEEDVKVLPEKIKPEVQVKDIVHKPLLKEGQPDYKLNHMGRSYGFRTIGRQTWMVENLAYLPSVSQPSQSSFSTPSYYVYGYEGNDTLAAQKTANYVSYGVLYNWEAAMKACPQGWHLPSYEEWNVLSDYLGTNAGGKLKESGPTHWLSSNLGATNEAQFSALPGGFLQGFGSGFFFIGDCAHFWTSSSADYEQAKSISLFSSASIVWRDNPPVGKANGLSVRCLRD